MRPAWESSSSSGGVLPTLGWCLGHAQAVWGLQGGQGPVTHQEWPLAWDLCQHQWLLCTRGKVVARHITTLYDNKKTQKGRLQSCSLISEYVH